MRILFLLIIIPVISNAAPHRLQAQDRIEKAMFLLNQIGQIEAKIEEVCDQSAFTLDEQENWGNLTGYRETLLTALGYLDRQLDRPEADLQDLRRRVTTPKHGRPTALVETVQNQVIISSRLARTRIAASDWCAEQYAFLGEKHARVWAQLDEASWHIVDTILEEQFGQP